MKKKHNNNKIFSILAGVLFICILNGVVIAQQKTTQKTNVRKDRKKSGFVSKSRQNQVSNLPEKKIVAIRRIDLIYDDVTKDGTYFKNKKRLVEIELYSEAVVIQPSIGLYMTIGDKVVSHSIAGNGQILFITIDEKEFESLIDDSFIVLRFGNRPTSKELKEMYKESIKETHKNAVSEGSFGKFGKSHVQNSEIMQETVEESQHRRNNTKKPE